MIRSIGISFLALSLCACASTKVKKVTVLDKVEVTATHTSDEVLFDVDQSFKMAKQHYADGDFKKALAGFDNTLTAASSDFDLREEALLGYADSALALAALSQDYRVKAAKAYLILLDTPEISEALHSRILAGQVLLEIAVGKSEDTEVRLNEALEVNLYDPRLWNALGHFHDRSGDWVLATETYVKAIEAAGEADYPLAPIVNNMGVSYLIRGQAKDALKKFEQAQALNENIEIYDNNRRLALILTGRMDKAIQNLSEKRAAEIYNDAGFISAERGQKRKARGYYKKAIELSPVYFEKAEINLLALSSVEPETGT